MIYVEPSEVTIELDVRVSGAAVLNEYDVSVHVDVDVYVGGV